MKRRHALKRAVALTFPLVSGCTSLGASTDGSSSISVSDVTDAAPHGFTFDVEVVSQPDETSPPGLRVSVENQSDEPQTLLLPEGLPLAQVFPANTGPSVLLVPENPDHLFVEEGDSFISLAELEDAPPNERVDGCWRLRHSIVEYYGGSSVTFSEEPEIGPAEELSPDESRTGRYSLYSSNSTRTCFPEGTYRFESSHYFGEDSPAGFTVQVD